MTERAKTWEAFNGTWSQFLNVEHQLKYHRDESDYTKILRCVKVKYRGPEFQVYQNACQIIWKRRRKERSVKSKLLEELGGKKQ